MAKKDSTVWGIHAGKHGEADDTFLKKHYLAVGWVKAGDFSKVEPDREAFKAKVAECYPEKKPRAIPTSAGQIFRYIHEMKIGDYVVYRSKQDRQIHIGQVTGDYKYAPAIDTSFPQVRSVKWLKSLPRTHFSQGALYEIGSALTFFQVKTYTDEFLAALEGKIDTPKPKDDVTVSIVAEEIEQNTRDFILKQLSQELKGHPLAEFVAHLMGTMGYRSRVSPEGPDGGVDIIAHKDELGFEPPIIKVQVKSSESTIGDPTVSALYGKVGSGEYGLLVTIGAFTAQARNFAKSKSNLRLIDGDELIDLVLLHYEQFDPRYKGLIPLRRVYVHEPIEEAEE